MAYFNIGRGFPKELMDGHWCYILKDLGYKALVIPSTSINQIQNHATHNLKWISKLIIMANV